jgi:hypothetical protein
LTDRWKNYSFDEIMDAWSEEEKSRLKECWKSLEGMREAQGELEKHVYGSLDLVFLFRASTNCVSCRDGIIEDTIEEENADPLSRITGEPTSAPSTAPHHDAATTEPQAGNVYLSHSTESDSSWTNSGSYSSGLGSYTRGLDFYSSGSGSSDET